MADRKQEVVELNSKVAFAARSGRTAFPTLNLERPNAPFGGESDSHAFSQIVGGSREGREGMGRGLIRIYTLNCAIKSRGSKGRVQVLQCNNYADASWAWHGRFGCNLPAGVIR